MVVLNYTDIATKNGFAQAVVEAVDIHKEEENVLVDFDFKKFAVVDLVPFHIVMFVELISVFI